MTSKLGYPAMTFANLGFEILQSLFFKLVTWEDIAGSHDGKTQILVYATKSLKNQSK